MPLLSKMSQCAWSFLQIFCWLPIDNRTYFDHHITFITFLQYNQGIDHYLPCFWLCHSCLLHATAEQNQLTKRKKITHVPFDLWPLPLSLRPQYFRLAFACTDDDTCLTFFFFYLPARLETKCLLMLTTTSLSFLLPMTRNVNSLAWWP